MLVSYPWLSQMPRFSQVRSDMRHAYEANLRIKPLSSTWNVPGPAEKSEGSELTGHKSMIMAMGIYVHNLLYIYYTWWEYNIIHDGIYIITYYGNMINYMIIYLQNL